MEIKVEGKNKKYAEILKEDYSSTFSDLSSFLLFKYESFLYFDKDNYFNKNMNKIANDSLAHIEILGRIISLLGGTPDHMNFKPNEYFYLKSKEELIEVNIRIIKEKIILYTKHLNEIEDQYIKTILTDFIIEERKNLEIMEIIQLKYKREKNHY